MTVTQEQECTSSRHTHEDACQFPPMPVIKNCWACGQALRSARHGKPVTIVDGKPVTISPKIKEGLRPYSGSFRGQVYMEG